MRWASAPSWALFGEIFFGNCVMLGIPCLRASQEDLEWLQKAIGREPQTPVQVDVEKQEVRFGNRVIRPPCPTARATSSWRGLGTPPRCCWKRARDRGDAGKLPYVRGY